MPGWYSLRSDLLYNGGGGIFDSSMDNFVAKETVHPHDLKEWIFISVLLIVESIYVAAD